MINKDIEGALEFIVEQKRNKYKEAFNLLKDKLPDIFSKEEEFVIKNIDGSIALAEHTAKEKGKKYSYEVQFIKDKNGKWKIVRF